MSRHTANPTDPQLLVFESSNPSDIQSRAQAAVAALVGRLVSAITLSGAGAGNRCVLEIEHTAAADGEGLSTAQVATSLRVFAGANSAVLSTSFSAALASAQLALPATPLGDTELSGSGDDGRFYGLLVLAVQQGGGGAGVITQAAWAVNAITGNDSNAGTPAAPLLTLAELQRRFEGQRLAQSTTISLTGDFYAVTPQRLILACIVPAAFTLTITGGAPTQTAAGTLTAAFVPYDPATNVDAKVTDAAQTWAPLLRQRIRMIDGAAIGAIAWLMKDLGANVVRVSQFVSPTTFNHAVPVNGDAYVVETLTCKIAGHDIQISGGGIVKTLDVWFESTSLAAPFTCQRLVGPAVPINNITNFILQVIGCSYTGAHVFAFSQFAVAGCSLGDASAASSWRTTHSRLALFSCVGWTGGLASNDQSTWIINGNTIIQTGALGIYNGGVVNSGFTPAFANGSIGIFDSTAATGCVDVSDGCSALVLSTASQYLFGSGNAGLTARVRPGCYISYITKPVITTGGGTDTTIGGAATAWAAVPFVNPANNAMIVVRA